MEYQYNLNDCFKGPVIEIKNNLLPAEFTGDRRDRWMAVNRVAEIINDMGEYSAYSQGLLQPVTTAQRLRQANQNLYLFVDNKANNGKGAVAGMLRVGKKDLYVFDRNEKYHHVTAPCVLDFYVHDNYQRRGVGKTLFDHMLNKEKVEPYHVAVDRPNEKILNFLQKNYKMSDPIKQKNGYIVFDQIFPKNPKELQEYGRSVSKCNGLQSIYPETTESGQEYAFQKPSHLTYQKLTQKNNQMASSTKPTEEINTTTARADHLPNSGAQQQAEQLQMPYQFPYQSSPWVNPMTVSPQYAPNQMPMQNYPNQVPVPPQMGMYPPGAPYYNPMMSPPSLTSTQPVYHQTTTQLYPPMAQQPPTPNIMPYQQYQYPVEELRPPQFTPMPPPNVMQEPFTYQSYQTWTQPPYQMAPPIYPPARAAPQIMEQYPPYTQYIKPEEEKFRPDKLEPVQPKPRQELIPSQPLKQEAVTLPLKSQPPKEPQPESLPLQPTQQPPEVPVDTTQPPLTYRKEPEVITEQIKQQQVDESKRPTEIKQDAPAPAVEPPQQQIQEPIKETPKEESSFMRDIKAHIEGDIKLTSRQTQNGLNEIDLKRKKQNIAVVSKRHEAEEHDTLEMGYPLQVTNTRRVPRNILTMRSESSK